MPIRQSAGLPVPDQGPEFMTRELIKVGNRDLNGNDFTWIVGEWLKDQTKPVELMAIERREWGNFYGTLVNVKQDGKVIAEGEAAWPELQARVDRVNKLAAQPTGWRSAGWALPDGWLPSGRSTFLAAALWLRWPGWLQSLQLRWFLQPGWMS